MIVSAAVEISGRYDELPVPVNVMASEGDLITHVDKHGGRFACQIPNAGLRIIPAQGQSCR